VLSDDVYWIGFEGEVGLVENSDVVVCEISWVIVKDSLGNVDVLPFFFVVLQQSGYYYFDLGQKLSVELLLYACSVVLDVLGYLC
jgi:hypothetical protein